MIKIFRALQSELGKVCYSEIFSGFHRFPFALYDGSKIMLDSLGRVFEGFELINDIYQKDWDGRFMGNSSINIGGNQLAIWDFRTCSKNMDILKLTSKIVHEMFHCYQGEFAESRWGDESIGLQYNLDAVKLSYKLEEYRLLRLTALSGDKKTLHKALSIRKQRNKSMGRFLDYEAGIETIEGMAVFVELSAYGQLVGKKKAELLKDYLPDSYNDPGFVIKNRVPSYYNGLLIAMILSENGREWLKMFKENRLYLWTILAKITDNTEYNCEVVINKDAVDAVEKRQLEIDSTFASFLKGDLQIDERECRLEGFDPMNTLYSDGMIYHRYFAKIGYPSEDVFLEGPLITVFDDDIFKVKKVITIRKKDS